MKKILYFAVTILIATGFVACNDDEDGVRLSSSPQVESAGKYTGKWTLTITQKLDENGDIKNKTLFDGESDGSVTLSASGQYISEATFDGDAIKQYMSDALTGKYNIAQTNNGFTIYNLHQVVTKEEEKDIDVGVEGATETNRTTEDKITLGSGEISSSKELVINGYSRTKQVTTGWKEPIKKGKIIIGTTSKNNKNITTYKISFVGTKE